MQGKVGRRNGMKRVSRAETRAAVGALCREGSPQREKVHLEGQVEMPVKTAKM